MTNQEKANGETPLYLCVTKNRKKRRLSLEISVRAEHWNIEKELPKKNCPNKEAIAKIIVDKKSECIETQMDFKALGKDHTAKTLIDSVKSPIKPMTVQTLFDEYIESLKKANRLNYPASYKQAMRKAVEFNKHLDIPFCVNLRLKEFFSKSHNLLPFLELYILTGLFRKTGNETILVYYHWM